MIAGDWLDVIRIAAAKGEISASATATLEGRINGFVEIIARATQPRLQVPDPLGGGRMPVRLEDSKIDAVDLVAEIGLRGKAGLKAQVDLSAAFELFGHDLWRQSWTPVNFDAGVAWTGGFKYSPNPGPHWDLGTVSADDQAKTGSSEAEALPEKLNEDAAEVDQNDIVGVILNENNAKVTTPDGLSEDTALPFEWRKPDEIYPDEVTLPKADDPKSVGRLDGPTSVRYTDDQGSPQEAKIGVADWPDVGRVFQFKDEGRKDTEKRKFKKLLMRLGSPPLRSGGGFDADHVWELNLYGRAYDRFDNLWPADYQEQELAGVWHNKQIANYRKTISALKNRYFVIVRIRPAHEE